MVTGAKQSAHERHAARFGAAKSNINQHKHYIYFTMDFGTRVRVCLRCEPTGKPGSVNLRERVASVEMRTV